MKILLIDDHALFREGLALLMAREFPGLELLQAGTLSQSKDIVEAHPDIRVVLLDLALPDGHGLSAFSWLQHSASAARVIALSADDSEQSVMEAIGAGAAGYVPKSANSTAMIQALRTVLGGGVHLPPSVTDKRTPGQHGAVAAPSAFKMPQELGLSPRQAEVLRMLIHGKANKAISRELEMSESTVKTHLAVIFRKLDANSRTQAVVAAAKLGLRLD
jgi:DNA-binding NarL/FixJ family response regulator